MSTTQDVENWDAEPGMLETWHVETRHFGGLECEDRMLEARIWRNEM